MLHSRRPLPLLLLLLLLAGASTAALATPQHRGRGREAPPPSAPAPRQVVVPQQGQHDRAPLQMPSPRAERHRLDRNQDALSDSIRRIERNTRGQVLSAERVPYDGRSVNRIKVVDDHGRVRIYMDDPQQAVDGTPTRDDDD